MTENFNSITYDENWQSVSESEYPVVTAPDDIDEQNYIEQPKSQRPKIDVPKQYLVTIQLVVCIIIALAAFVLKNIGGELYNTVQSWYYSQIEDSAIFDGKNNFDLSQILGKASSDEI